MRLKTLLPIWLLLCVSCLSVPPEVEESLELAGKNRKELEKTLRHYNRKAKDSLKFRAACFLIENMRWHYSEGTIRYADPHFRQFCSLVADTLFWEIYKEKGKDSINQSRNLFWKRYRWLSDSLQKFKYQESVFDNRRVCDLERIDSRFLISHIDNAFDQWHTSPFARQLSFEDFCEYLLPYRCMNLFPDHYSGELLNGIFGKYININPEAALDERGMRYNRIVFMFHNFFKKRPQELGLAGIFFQGQQCTEIASYGCNILRACGIPMSVEFCQTYRDFDGGHTYCAIPDSAGNWIRFNPETSQPGKWEGLDEMPMSLFREYYSAQPDAPYFLKAEHEHLPTIFNNPCLREVSAEQEEAFRVVLPLEETTDNHLAWLAGWLARQGMRPATWGKIDTTSRKAIFETVLANRLYFPYYYQGDTMRFFATPFYIEKDTTTEAGYRLHTFECDTSNCKQIILTRKFPRKPNMIRLAKNLIGSVFLGANKQDFSDARELYKITKEPMPYLQDYPLKHPSAYRFYRFRAPEEHPHANVAMLEFLTDKKFRYKNSLPPTRRAILSPEDTGRIKEDAKLVKLLDAPSWDKMKWKPEYDGNMQTAPSTYRAVTMRLKEPQVVERIRFAPKNADNGIKEGHVYELFFWNGEKWCSLGKQTARYEYLVYENVPEGPILWLRNYTTGKEELPFIIRNGTQQFFYYDF